MLRGWWPGSSTASWTAGRIVAAEFKSLCSVYKQWSNNTTGLCPPARLRSTSPSNFVLSQPLIVHSSLSLSPESTLREATRSKP